MSSKTNEEEELNATNITKKIIGFMNYGGCSPKQDKKFKYNGYILIFLTVSLEVLILLNFFSTSHSTVSSLMEDSIMLLGNAQFSVKCFTIVNKRKTLSAMLDTIWYKFWPTNHMDKKFKQKINFMYKTGIFVSKLYMNVVLMSVFLFVTQAALKKTPTLVMEIWAPNKEILKQPPVFLPLFVFQAICLTAFVSFGVIPCDAMFIIITTAICIQFKMIRLQLLKISNKINDKENYEIIKEVVMHHNLLLRFLKLFDFVYSRLFLPTAATSFILMSMTMYGVVMEDTINRKMTNVFIYTSVSVQLFAYCFAGQLIQDENMNVGNDAYNCNWVDVTDKKVKDGLITIIIKSTRQFNLNVGGLMILNLPSFAAVARASFTVLAFIFNVRA